MESIFGGFFKEILVAVIAAIFLAAVGFLWGRRTKLYNWIKIVKLDSFHDHFSEIEKHSVSYEKLRILANSTNVVLPHFQESDLIINECEIILRTPKANETLFANYIDTVEQDWRNLKEKGKITKLTIHFIDTLLLDFQVIFDDKFMLLGINTINEKDWKRYEILETFLVINTSKSSKEMIEEYSKRFDSLFKNTSESKT